MVSLLIIFWFFIMVKTNYSVGVPLSKSLVMGAWYWESPESADVSQYSLLLEKAHKNSINTIYLSIDGYLDLVELKDSAEKTQMLNWFNNNVIAFITKAQENHIAVQALAGATNWVTDDYAYIPPLFLTYVQQFNQAHPSTPFEGIQYDIEFYNDPSYGENKVLYSQKYIQLLTTLVQQSTQTPSLKLGFAIPFWFDSNVPMIPINSQSKLLYQHLFDVLDTYENSYVAIMDYRNYTDGEDGAINLIKNEFDYLASENKSVDIIIGQETTNVEPAKITFYGMSKSKLHKNMQLIYKQYASHSSMKGFAIHDLEGFLQLR